MQNLTWIGVVVWGVLIAGFGLLTTSPLPAAGVHDVQAQDALFLMSGGLIISMLGAAGLFGLIGQSVSVVKLTK